MKKSLLLLVTTGLTLLSGGQLLAQSAPATPKQQRLIHVSTLNTIEANQAFQNNVQIMQARRQELLVAKDALDKETNAAKKKDLKTKVDALLAKLNEDNQTMLKAYGFTLERNYTIAPVVSHVYMMVTDEEAARFDKEQAAAAKKKK
ncbi:MAG: hypothetical protein Q8N18_21925 [Opitutaceae bacterium]|nr:hypothetical protein [Opitutaceae bacterium]